MSTRKPQQPREVGFTLVEVLVALVVLSVGMLGLMGLQAVALQQNNSAQTRSYAIDFINELADRMRANRAGVDAYLDDPVDPGFDCVKTYPGGGTTCNPQQMAMADLFAWTTSAAFVFPQSQVSQEPPFSVQCTDNRDPGFSDNDGDGINDADTDGDVCTDGSLFVISLSWSDDRRAPDATTTYRVMFAP